MINLGVRAHDFGKYPADLLAAMVAAKGFGSVQLALAKALDGINTDTGAFSPGLARHVRQAFERHGVSIAVLGCYINPIDPDPVHREQQMDRFKVHLRYARDFGCSVVATETGSRNADWSHHPDNASDSTLAELTDQIGELVREAEKFGVLVCIEGVCRHVVSTPARLKRVLDSIGSPNLQVLFDPVNFLSLENYRDQQAITSQAFESFGDSMAVIHLKDFVPGPTALDPAPIGEGAFDFARLFDELGRRKSYIDMLLEETSPTTVEFAGRAIRRLAKRMA